MGLFSRYKIARDVALKSTFSQPLSWSADYPIGSSWWGGAGSGSNREQVGNNFESYVNAAYKANGPVFAVMTARAMAFTEARFTFREIGEDGRPGELHGSGHGNSALSILRNPWPGGTTGELLGRMLQDADLAGNSFWTKADDSGRLGNSAGGEGLRLVRMRPDWVTLVIGTKQGGEKASPNALDSQVLFYIYRDPTGKEQNEIMLLPDEVAHFSPNPDPSQRFVGMSWLTPVLREIEADKLAVVHKKKFLQDAAVPNLAIKFDKDTGEDEFHQFVASFKSEHQGAFNAYKTLFLMGGADVSPLSMDFRQMEFNQSIGKGESRIASAGGVPSSWVGFSEGLTGSGLNSQGVFQAARRRFADATIRPLWRIAAASLAVLISVPAGSELWFDESGIAFLREDERDRAEILRTDMNALDAAIRAGFDPDASVQAVQDRNLGRLTGKHTGLVSVQMMSPKTLETEAEQVEVTAKVAQAAQALALAGFSPESISNALKPDGTIDLAALKKAELPAPMPGAPPGGAPGQPKPQPNKPQNGGGNGGQQGAPRGGN